MDLKHGLLLFIIGTTISIVAMVIAFYVGSKDQKKEKLTEVQKSIRDLKL